MISANRDVLVESWNTQGLGNLAKRPVVRDAISSASPSIVCSQETKLPSVDRFTAASFLPTQLSDFLTVDAIGSSGGIPTAWHPTLFSLVASHRASLSLTVKLRSSLSDLLFAISNIYAPADHSLTPSFLLELEGLGPLFPIPWSLVRDFNLIWSLGDKNNSNFNSTLASAFNDSIRNLALLEFPLLDHLYTWSNKRDA
jgi:hypothetical protein